MTAHPSQAFTYRCLSPSDFEALHKCFLAAFVDYVVSMQISADHFRQRLFRDGVELELSVAAFAEIEMVGFSLNAPGKWQGVETAYDAGTAVLPSYRGEGVGKNMFAFMTQILKERNVHQCLLEVISTNVPAVRLYKNLGFEQTRTLAVLRSETFPSSRNTSGVELRTSPDLNWSQLKEFWSGEPSWQNSIAAIERVKSECTLVAGYDGGGECVGYGVAFNPGGTLMQLAVADKNRRKGIGSTILAALHEDQGAKPLKINNVDYEIPEAIAFYETNGFKIVLDQFEMIKKL
ncbi:MAG: hypothetical protein C5B44_06310 [Acidobacteria bacterium]|nr:MAG: hypothetical protein C5B44_06310 [Acidobacteriota bacterium]